MAPLGTTKVIMLSRMSPARVRGLLRPKRHQLPGGGPKLTLEQMTSAQLASLLAEVPTLEAGASVALRSYRRRVTGLLHATEELIALGDVVDRDRARGNVRRFGGRKRATCEELSRVIS